MSDRRIALEALMDITDRGAYANLRLKEIKGLDERQTKWITAAVYTTLDHLLYIDHVIAAYAKGRLKPQIRGILRLGVCQVLYMNVPDSAACDESVRLTKEIGKSALTGFVNGVMRNICRNKSDLPPLPKEPVRRLSVKYSYPEYLVREYLAQYGEGFVEQMLAAHTDTAMTLRAQYPYTSEKLAYELDKRGISYTRGGLCHDAFKLNKGIDVTADELFTSGKMTVQSESAMLVCRALCPKQGMSILDACAAPGGKSAYIADMTENKAKLISWELHPHRAELMKKSFERLGVNAKIDTRDASKHDAALDAAFDAVLIDAPCSGLGVPGKPDARYAKSDVIIADIATIQKGILEACASYVKPGGILVYATCTISRRENEEQIESFINRHSEYSPESLVDIFPTDMGGRLKDGCMIQLFPHLDQTEGFFIAKLRRNS